MDSSYSTAYKIIQSTRIKLNEIMKAAPYKGFENAEANNELEDLIAHLEMAERTLSYLSVTPREGQLEYDPTQERYYIAYDDGTESGTLHAGDGLEAFVNDEWHIGRVEHRTAEVGGGYYFYGPGRPSLQMGMRVRSRITD